MPNYNEIPATQNRPFVAPHIVSSLPPFQAEDDGSKKQEFESLARPMIQWLNENYHPHVTVIITPVGAELLVGEMAFQTNDYLKD